MKRRREEQIILDALQGDNCEVTADIKKAVSSGLRHIRQERFDERMAQKAKMKRNARLLSEV